MKEPKLMEILGVLLSHGQRGSLKKDPWWSTNGIGEALATKDKVIEDAAEEAAQEEGIINTISVPHLEVVSS